VSGTTSAGSSVKSTNTAMCSNSSTTAIGAGLGVGLGVSLLVALAGLLWLMARRRYEKPQTAVPVASRSSKPELFRWHRDQVSRSCMGIARSRLQDIMGVIVKALQQVSREGANCL
jgi:hypothetical protein